MNKIKNEFCNRAFNSVSYKILLTASKKAFVFNDYSDYSVPNSLIVEHVFFWCRSELTDFYKNVFNDRDRIIGGDSTKQREQLGLLLIAEYKKRLLTLVIEHRKFDSDQVH